MAEAAKQAHRYSLDAQPRIQGSALNYHHAVPGKGMNFLRAHLKAGFHFSMHSHDNDQMTYVLSGKTQIAFENGQPPLTLGPGDVAHIPGGIRHDLTALEDSVQIEIFSPARNELVTGMPSVGKPVEDSGL